jgi:hypothetical protein
MQESSVDEDEDLHARCSKTNGFKGFKIFPYLRDSGRIEKPVARSVIKMADFFSFCVLDRASPGGIEKPPVIRLTRSVRKKHRKHRIGSETI